MKPLPMREKGFLYTSSASRCAMGVLTDAWVRKGMTEGGDTITHPRGTVLWRTSRWRPWRLGGADAAAAASGGDLDVMCSLGRNNKPGRVRAAT